MAQDLCTIDILIASILAISVLVGFFRGAIKEILTVVSWIGAIFLTILLFPLGKSIISNFVQQPLLVDLITYVIVFIVFLVVLSAFTCVLSSVVKSSVLAMPNRIGGALFGILRGILILVTLDFGISQYILQDYEEYVKQSKLRPYIKDTSKMIFIMLPESLRQSLLKHLSLEQQKELLNKFDINNNQVNTQTLANVQALAEEINNTSNNNSNDQSSNKDNNTGQTAQELSELKVKETNSSTFFKDTKKDLDKLLDTYT